MVSKLLKKQMPIQINSVKSDLLENTYSVLQGSILQPLLCLTYTLTISIKPYRFQKYITFRMTQTSCMRVITERYKLTTSN